MNRSANFECPTVLGNEYTLPYHLSGFDGEGVFYDELNRFSREVVAEGNLRLGKLIDQFRDSSKHMSSPEMHEEEHLLDLLIMGVLWNEYAAVLPNISPSKAFIFNRLSHVRNKFPALKKRVDQIRGKLAFRFLLINTTGTLLYDTTTCDQLVGWLKATGDFYSEADRIAEWNGYFKSLASSNSNHYIRQVCRFAEWFKARAAIRLGNYTLGVSRFLESHHVRYKGREDYFFTGRHEVEYHLNMVGAAIMNRCFREGFKQAKRKIVMLPKCMVKNASCKATMVHGALLCKHCTPTCNVSQITLAMKEQGVETIVIEHTSQIGKTLKHWAKDRDTGIVGTSCVLNLLQGGFEMKRNQIASQCIFLDHSCCSHHWGVSNKKASIDLKQLNRIVH